MFVNMNNQIPQIVPVLSSINIKRDVEWYQKYTGFMPIHFNDMYAVLKKENLSIHLQWHANTKDDPHLGGAVIKIFVDNINPIFKDFVKRGTITKDKLKLNTPWQTNEFGFYDLNKNAIFIVEDI